MTLNHAWRRRAGGGMYLHPLARRWKEEIALVVLVGGITPFPPGPLCAIIDAYPPDRRRRDADNLGKHGIDTIFALHEEDDYREARFEIERHAPLYPPTGAPALVIEIVPHVPRDPRDRENHGPPTRRARPRPPR